MQRDAIRGPFGARSSSLARAKRLAAIPGTFAELPRALGYATIPAAILGTYVELPHVHGDLPVGTPGMSCEQTPGHGRAERQLARWVGSSPVACAPHTGKRSGTAQVSLRIPPREAARRSGARNSVPTDREAAALGCWQPPYSE